ncbi:MAG: CpXC domain-containing protein [Anaerovoracaceae bacterium]|jgi:endogenous inhibitor of DNA gyrase (YacG/DUF329 family)
MAKTTRSTINCPGCGREVTVEMIDSADGVADPQVKEAILEGDFAMYKCPECGEGIDLLYQFAYHDGSKKLLLWMLPPSEDGDEDVEASEDFIKTSFLMEDCAMRKVRDKNELREKVLLAESGRDDRIVEVMKPGVYSVLTEKVGGKQIIAILYEKNSDGEYFVIQLDTGEVGTIDFPEEMYDGIKERYGDQIEEATGDAAIQSINNEWAAEFVQNYMVKKN